MKDNRLVAIGSELEAQGIVKTFHIDPSEEAIGSIDLQKLMNRPSFLSSKRGLEVAPGNEAGLGNEVVNDMRFYCINDEVLAGMPTAAQRGIELLTLSLNERLLSLFTNAPGEAHVDAADELRDLCEEDAVLLHRYVADRAEFVKTWAPHLLDAKEAIATLGLSQTNSNRTISQKEQKNTLLAFKYEGRSLVPDFQFTPKGEVYPQIIDLIGRAKNNGYTSMEVSSWLVTQRSVTLSATEIPEDIDLSTLSFEESEGYFEALDTQDEVWTGKPIDALKENNLIVWQRNVDDWLNSDSITVPFLKAESEGLSE